MLGNHNVDCNDELYNSLIRYLEEFVDFIEIVMHMCDIHTLTSKIVDQYITS